MGNMPSWKNLQVGETSCLLKYWQGRLLSWAKVSSLALLSNEWNLPWFYTQYGICVLSEETILKSFYLLPPLIMQKLLSKPAHYWSYKKKYVCKPQHSSGFYKDFILSIFPFSNTAWGGARWMKLWWMECQAFKNKMSISSYGKTPNM